MQNIRSIETLTESLSDVLTSLETECPKAYRIFSVRAFTLALVATGILAGCDMMRGDQIVFVVDDNSVDATIDNEAVAVKSHRKGKVFSEIKMTNLSAYVGVMSELNRDSGYTMTVTLMVPAPFTTEPGNITISLESQTPDGKWVSHLVEVAENFPWRKQGTPGDDEHKQGTPNDDEQVWWAQFRVSPDLKSSECERLRLRIQIELDGPNDIHHNVDVFLKLKREKITIPNPIVLRFSGKYGSRSLAAGDFTLIRTGTASNEIGGTSTQYLQQA